MKTSGVSQLSILTSSECEEPISALLERIFAVTPSIYVNAETHQTSITAYVRTTPAKLHTHTTEIKSALADLEQLGLNTAPAEIEVAPVRREDWAESWKKHFKLIRIGSALVIKPSWTKIKSEPGQAVVTLDPGLSFGTGQHATTHFCLTQIVRGGARLLPSQNSRRAKSAQRSPSRLTAPLSLLDIGCGSGILAISAAKLGFAPVAAFDFDPVAVRAARKNCRTNRVENKISISRKDLTKLPLNSRQKYDVVCANLMAPLLISERDRILNRLAPGGTLILAGILATEFPSVLERYQSAGLHLFAEKTEREWRSGAFHRLKTNPR